MKLNSISLVNYRQHRNMTIRFDGHMIAVVGSNGSGKSNFLGAIQFALTGEQPGFNKEDLLNWEAARNHESGYVELEFEHAGKSCTIRRSIDKASATLKVGDDTFTGIKKVQEAMESLQIDRDVLRQSVFVRQTEIESVLFDDPRERELAFQKLVGLGDAAKHQKILTEFISSIREPRDMSEDIQRQKELLEGQEAQLADLESRAGIIGGKMAAMGDEEAINDRIRGVQAKMAIIGKAISSFEVLATAKSDMDEATRKYGDAAGRQVEDTSSMDSEIEDLAKFDSENAAALARNKTRKGLDSAISSTEAELQHLPPDIAGMVREYETHKSEMAALEGRMTQLGKLMGNAPNGNVCPLCGSTTSHNIREELQGELDSASSRRDELASWMSSHKHIPGLPAQLAGVQAKLKDLVSRREDMGGEEKTVDQSVIHNRRMAVASQRAKVLKDNADILAARNMISAQEKVVESAKASLEVAMSKIPGNHTLEELEKVFASMESGSNSLLEQLNILSSLKAEKASLEGGITQVKAAMDSARDEIARLEKLDADNRVAAERLKVAKDVRDWFSYKNGPRVMSQAVMRLLVDSTNKYLGQFGSPFTVVSMEEGMGFRCVFTDGRVTSNPPPEATMLSGGQKIALAVAFRFAVYSMFASKLGLLSLDEPTAYLDDQTISRFADLLARIREMTSNMGVQVLMATHEKSLSPVFDQTVEIGG